MTSPNAETTAAELRKAATLMRLRAQSATPSPWWLHPNGDTESVWHGDRDRLIAYDRDASSGCDLGEAAVEDRLPWGTVATLDAPYQSPQEAGDALFIASWHPAVALAVADWLEHAAKRAEVWSLIGDEKGATFVMRHPLAVARAYLDETTANDRSTGPGGQS